MALSWSFVRCPSVRTASSMRRSVAMSAATSSQPKVQFCKYHGLGNDFILVRVDVETTHQPPMVATQPITQSAPLQVDNRHAAQPIITQEEAIRLCDRNFGIGGDGVIFALPAEGDTDYTMRIFNSDGSEPEMCGNGIRCLARFVADIDNAEPRTYKVHTLAGA